MKYLRLQYWKHISVGTVYLFLLAAGLYSCKEDYSEPVMEEVQLVNSLELDIQEVTLAKGMTQTIKYNVIPDNAYDKSIAWFSGDDKIATVVHDRTIQTIMQETTIQAVDLGDVIIAGKSLWDALAGASVSVHVVPVAESLELKNITMFNSTQISMSELKSSVTTVPEEAYKESFDIESNNLNVVAFENGVLKAKGEGDAMITIISKDGSNLRATAQVTVEPAVIPEDITFVSGQEFALNEVAKLDFTMTPVDATIELLKWKSSDEKVVTVNERGNITAKSYGSADITATTPDGKVKTTTITVIKGKISDSGIALSQYELSNQATGNIQNGILVVKWPSGISKNTNLKRKEPIYINADTYPILAIKVNGQVQGKGNPNVIWHNIDLHTALGTPKQMMIWEQVKLTNDGNHVYYVDLQTNFGGLYKGKGVQATTNFNCQTGYDQNGGPEQTELSVYWIRSFKSLNELDGYISNEK
jgi:uncharacterized protein YjdB